MKTSTILFLFLFLPACATTAPPAAPIIARATTVEPIRIPILVPCLSAEQIPKPPSSFMRAGRTGDYNELAAAIDLKQADEYVVKSQSLMWGCVKAFEAETKPQ